MTAPLTPEIERDRPLSPDDEALSPEEEREMRAEHHLTKCYGPAAFRAIFATLDACRESLLRAGRERDAAIRERDAWRAADDVGGDEGKVWDAMKRGDAIDEARRLRAENEEAERG